MVGYSLGFADARNEANAALSATCSSRSFFALSDIFRAGHDIPRIQARVAPRALEFRRCLPLGAALADFAVGPRQALRGQFDGSGASSATKLMQQPFNRRQHER